MTRLRKAVSATIVVIVVVIGIRFAMLDRSQIQTFVIKQLEQMLNQPIAISGFNWGFAPPRFRLDGVRVSEFDDIQGGDLFFADSVEVDLKFWSLIFGNPQVTGIRMNHPTIFLRRSGTGHWNFSRLGSQSGSGKVTIKKWSIEDGTIVIETSNQKPMGFSHIDVVASGINETSAFPFHFAFRSEEGLLKGDGRMGPVTLQTISATPIFVHLEAIDFQIRDSFAVLRSLAEQPIDIRIDGRVTGVADVQLMGGTPQRMDGAMSLNSISIQHSAWREPVQISVAKVQLISDSASLTDVNGRFGETDFRGSANVTNFGKPQIRMDLTGETLDLASLFALVRTSESKQATVFPDFRGTLKFDRFRWNDTMGSGIRADVALENDNLIADPIEFGIYGGIVKGRFTFNSGQHPKASWRGSVTGLDSTKLFESAASLANYLQGNIDGSLQLQFPTDDNRPIMEVIEADGELRLKDGSIRVPLLERLTQLAALARPENDSKPTRIEKMWLPFQIRNGWLLTSGMILNTPDLDFTATGQIHLITQQLSLNGTALLKRIAVGTRMSVVRGFVTDENGRPVIPFKARGTLSAPQFTLDTARLVQPQQILRELFERFSLPN
jgi:hypothetical protein